VKESKHSHQKKVREFSSVEKKSWMFSWVFTLGGIGCNLEVPNFPRLSGP